MDTLFGEQALVDVTNDLTPEQRLEMSEKLEKLIRKFNVADPGALSQYFSGVQDGLNHAYKLVNEIDDDYNFNG